MLFENYISEISYLHKSISRNNPPAVNPPTCFENPSRLRRVLLSSTRMNYLPTNFLSRIEADRSGDAIRGMHSRCMVIRSRGLEGTDAWGAWREEATTLGRKTEDDVRKRGGGGMKRDEQTKRRRKVYISGHYFLQYFNVKSSGFLEPPYRFLQEKPSGRSGKRVFRDKGGSLGGKGREERR